MTVGAATINRLDLLIQKSRTMDIHFSFIYMLRFSFHFFPHFSFFYFCLCCSSSLNMINVCECIFSRLRILMMQCIQYDVVLRALSSIIFLPIWIWIMRPSMLPLPNSSLFLQYLMRLFLLLLQKHISLSFMPFFFAFLLFSVSLLFDSLSGWYNALALWTH